MSGTVSDRPPVPSPVRRGLLLLGASLVPGVVDLATGQMPPSPGLPPWFTTVVVVVSLFFNVLIGFLILLGRNWARILFAVLVAIGIPMMLAAAAGLAAALGDRPTRAILVVVQSVMQIVAAVMFFLPEANAWFRAMKALRKAG